MKKGDIVITTKHNHKMSVKEIDGNKVTCQYFIDKTLHEEKHDSEDLTIWNNQ